MEIKDAIRLLKTKKGQPSTDYQLGEALQMAISALEKQGWHNARKDPPKRPDGMEHYGEDYKMVYCWNCRKMPEPYTEEGS